MSYSDIVNVVRDGLTEDGSYLLPGTLEALHEKAAKIGGAELIRVLEVYTARAPYAACQRCGDEDPFWFAAVEDDEKPGRTGYRFTTGGWSGAEDLITALMPSVGWLLLWQVSVRGGTFYFSDPEAL